MGKIMRIFGETPVLMRSQRFLSLFVLLSAGKEAKVTVPIF